MKEAKAKLIPADDDEEEDNEIINLDTVQSPKKGATTDELDMRKSS